MFANETPEAPLYTLWLKNIICFGLRGMTEHYNLELVDIKLKKKSVGGTYILECNERQSEREQGKILWPSAKSNTKWFRIGMQEVQLIFTNYMQQKYLIRYNIRQMRIHSNYKKEPSLDLTVVAINGFLNDKLEKQSCFVYERDGYKS